jgi:carbon monoxide dehydrogenase subunit G
MELEASRALPASREAVWAALNDPETLRRCIPGCESLERGEDGALAARMTARVGPVSARFAGTVALHDLAPPESYRLAFQGQGGAAGFAKGEAWVRLEATEAGGTTMHYRSKASVGGKLAQVGARLIDASARKIADDFFERFVTEVAPAPAPAAVEVAVPPPGAPGAETPVAPAAEAAAPQIAGTTPAVPPAPAAPARRATRAWIAAAVVAALLVWWWLR